MAVPPLTVGSEFQVDTDGGLARVVTLTATTAIVLYSDATNGISAEHITRSNLNLSVDDELAIDGNHADSITICRLSDTTAVIGYCYGSTHRTQVLTYSGGTLSAGAVTNMTDTGVDYLSCQFLDTNKIIYVYTDSSGNGRSVALTISGTTITENAIYTWLAFVGNSAALNVVEVVDTTTALVGYGFDPGAPSSSFYELLDITGTTVTTLDSLGNVGSFVIDLAGTLDLSTSTSDPNFVFFSYVENASKDIRYGLIDCTGGALAVDYDNALIVGTFNCASLAAMYLDTGSSGPYDVVLFVQNDTAGNNLYIYAEDQWTADNADNTDITTTASTASMQVRRFPGTRYCIAVWNESTEAVVISLVSGYSGQRPLVQDINKEDGTDIFVTTWEDGNLYLYNRATADLSFVSQAPFGAAASSDLDSRAVYLAPYAPIFPNVASFGDYVYAYGRWDDGSVKHLALSTSAGASGTFGSNLGDATWGTDWVGAFFADDPNTFYAFVNGASRALWRSLDGGSSWTSLSSLPFDVDPGGTVKHPDGRILIINRATGTQMAALSQPPNYSSWVDVTGNPAFPTAGGGARSVKWIV